MRLLLTFLVLMALPILPAHARTIVDSAGRTVEIPEDVNTVFAAGPPASILVYIMKPEALTGWPRALRPEERAYIAEPYRDLPETGRLTGRGGEANLVMVESDDPLEAGLEIRCQPPGKKLSTLSLMSGGEQTLTCLALIFAVFLANPSPICVLDEVDAPLDDANVDRFCNMLDEMRSRTETRFITITHNPVTMARMDRLFGVTMAERGVSQLVSVDLRQAEALAAE